MRWLRTSVAAPVAVALIVGTIFVVLRLVVSARGDITKFVVAGAEFTDRSQAPAGLAVGSGPGYDGQFYYRLALDPLDFRDVAFGIRIEGDQQLRRDRIALPAFAFVLSGGAAEATPWAIVALNLAALGGIAWCGAELARMSRRAPLWGLLFLAYPLLYFSLGRDLTELTEVALLLAGILALRRERLGWATLALTWAVLARETALLVVVAIAADRIVRWVQRRDRPGATDLVWLVPGAAFAIWQGVIGLATGSFGFGGGSKGMGAPFMGSFGLVRQLFDLATTGGAPGLLRNAEALTLLVAVVYAAVGLLSTDAPRHERWAFVLLTLFATLFFGAGTWREEAGIRAFADLYALAVLVALGSKRRLVLPSAVAAMTSAAAMVQLVRFV